jgi:hypothetical protein
VYKVYSFKGCLQIERFNNVSQKGKKGKVINAKVSKTIYTESFNFITHCDAIMHMSQQGKYYHKPIYFFVRIILHELSKLRQMGRAARNLFDN